METASEDEPAELIFENLAVASASKSLSARGGSASRSTGNVGLSSAGGEASRDTTTTGVETSGSGSGEGAVLTVVHKVAGDSKETTTTLSSGRENGSSTGDADGILAANGAANGAGAGTEFDVHGDASGSSSGKTKRTTTVSDPTNRSRAVISRSDTSEGSLTSDGTVATGGGHVEREGDVSGNSQSGAQITFDYTANGDGGGGVFSFGREVGSIYTDLSLNFEGGWDEADLHGEGKRASGEDSTSTDGWQKYLPDANGFHWSGATTTRTLVTRDQVSTELSEEEEGEGEGEGEDADQAKGPRTTDRVNISSFEIDSHPDDFHGITKNWTSTLTVQQHDDGASESHQVEWVNAERKEYVSSGGHDVEEVKSDKGDHTKTLTVKGDKSSLKIERNATETESEKTVKDLSSGYSANDHEWDEFTTSTTTTDNYRYDGSHTINESGLAVGGTFDVKHDVVTDSTESGRYDYWAYDNPNWVPLENAETVGAWRQVSKAEKTERRTTENGAYFDVMEEDKALRQQSGTYTIVETSSVDWPQEKNYLKHHDEIYMLNDWEVVDYVSRSHFWTNKSGTTTATTEGSYAPSGSVSTKTYASDRKEVTGSSGKTPFSESWYIQTESVTPTEDGSELYTQKYVEEYFLHKSINEFDYHYVNVAQQTIVLEPGDSYQAAWNLETPEFVENPSPKPQTVEQPAEEPGILSSTFSWIHGNVLQPVGTGLTAVGNGIRSGTHYAAGGIENLTQTGNDNLAGNALAFAGGWAGHGVRLIGGIAGGVVDVPGTAGAVAEEFGQTKRVYDEHGLGTAAARQIGLLAGAETYYGIDVLTGEQVDAWQKAAEAAGRLGGTAATATGIGAGLTRFARPRVGAPNSNVSRFITNKAGETVDVGPTLERIRSGGTFPHRNDGTIFRNREGLLPAKPPGYYKEFVHPTPGVPGAGLQRIIQGEGGELFFTPDHYRTFIPLNPTGG